MDVGRSGPGPGRLRVDQLATAEQLVVWALRSRLEGPHRRAALRHGFDLANAREVARDPLPAFEALFDLLAGSCRRDLWFHRRRCCQVSDDECRILGLIASLQSGDFERAVAAARSLVPDRAAGQLLWVASGFANDLVEIGLGLPVCPAPTGNGAGRGIGAGRHH